MTALILFGRIALAAVLFVAGVTKLRRWFRLPDDLIDFGLPRPLALIAGKVVPSIELMTAGLLVSPLAGIGAAIATVLFSAFSVGIALNLALGRKVACHCFGVAQSSKVSVQSFIRTASLAAMAAWLSWPVNSTGVLQQSPLALTIDRIGLGAAAQLLLTTVVLAVQSWFMLHLLRQHGRILSRLEVIESRVGLGAQGSQAQRETPVRGLPVGSPAPDIQLIDLNGGRLTLQDLPLPACVVFSDPGCGPCEALMPKLASWSETHTLPYLLVVSRGDVLETARKYATVDTSRMSIGLQRTREVSDAYQASGTPIAVLIDTQRRIASPLALGSESILALLQAFADSQQDVAPNLTTEREAVPTH